MVLCLAKMLHPLASTSITTAIGTRCAGTEAAERAVTCVVPSIRTLPRASNGNSVMKDAHLPVFPRSAGGKKP